MQSGPRINVNPQDQSRRDRQHAIFGGELPQLWCPLLTHFQARAMPDEAKMIAHLDRISPWVHGLLVPGSTGEGWEMSDEDIRCLLGIVLDGIRSKKMRLLIGILKTETEAVLKAIDGLYDLLSHPSVAGITVCPAKSAGQSQAAIKHGLERVLDRGIATALYQLPQVTGNEMSSETVAELASAFDNFILFKDTSGKDRVAQSGADLRNVFLVRGSEQDGYSKWTKKAGGPYDGFLLSTANVFAEQYSQMLDLQATDNFEQANDISDRLSSIVSEAFSIVAHFPIGNPFTNANKLMDHLVTYGPEALNVAAPLLYSGVRLPQELLISMKELFDRKEAVVGRHRYQ